MLFYLTTNFPNYWQLREQWIRHSWLFRCWWFFNFKQSRSSLSFFPDVKPDIWVQYVSVYFGSGALCAFARACQDHVKSWHYFTSLLGESPCRGYFSVTVYILTLKLVKCVRTLLICILYHRCKSKTSWKKLRLNKKYCFTMQSFSNFEHLK